MKDLPHEEHAEALLNGGPGDPTGTTAKPNGAAAPPPADALPLPGDWRAEKLDRDLRLTIEQMVKTGIPAEAIVPKLALCDSPTMRRAWKQPDPEAYLLGYVKEVQAEIDGPLHEMNARHAVIKNYGARVRVMSEGDPPVFQSFDDFRNRYLNHQVMVRSNPKTGEPIFKPAGSWWLEHPRRREFERVEFLPGQSASEGVFNLWRGWTVTPIEGACGLFLDFVGDVIAGGDPEMGDYVLDWLAHLFQRPQEQAQVAVALRSGQGTGKGFLAKHVGELLGRHYLRISDPKHLIGHFNAPLQHALLVFADEAFAADDKKSVGVLKALVTEDELTIEPKGVDPFQARRFFRLILGSNEDWIVPADADDRRFLVVDVSEAHKEDHAYFAAIEAEWTAGGREAFLAFLLARDITAFNHRTRPHTAALDDQKIDSLRGASQVVFEMLAEGSAQAAKRDGPNVFIVTRALHEQTGSKCTETALGRELAKASRQGKSTREVCNDGQQRHGFWLPRLSEARQLWSLATKFNAPWPDDDGEWDVAHEWAPSPDDPY